MRRAGACRCTWELPLGCCGGVWRWAVGVCWRSGVVKWRWRNKSAKKDSWLTLCSRDDAAIKDAEDQRLTDGGLSLSHSDAELSLSFFRRKTSERQSPQRTSVWRTKTVVAGALPGSCGKKFRATLPPVRRLTHAGSRACV